jgi:hypothetical protein
MNIVDRAKSIIMSPKTEWSVVAGEEPNVGQIIVGYVIPLAAVPAVATIIGMGLIGSGLVTSFSVGIATGIGSFIAAVVGVYVTAFIVDLLAPNFGSQKGFGRAVQLVAYSYTPAWVAGILNIVPPLAPIALLAGLYGLYLLYLGLPHTMKTPQDKVAVYLIVTIIVLILVFFILAAILTPIMFAIFGIGMLGAM